LSQQERTPGVTGGSGRLEREKEFEPERSRAFSGTYAAPENAPESPSRPPDASIRVSTETDGGDTHGALPLPTLELFLEAGFIVATRAADALAGEPALVGIVHRAVQHAMALREGQALRRRR
jgi:hypothetical protein